MSSFRVRILFATALIGICGHGLAFGAETDWRAGVARVNISPELPIWLSGYGARDKPARYKNDELWAKALVIEDADGHRAALVTMDLVGIPRDLSQSACEEIEARFKLPRAAIALSASHTHSGPVVRGNLMAMYSLDQDQMNRIKEYKTALVKKIVSVVGEAMETMKPAKLTWGMGTADFAINRRNNQEGKVKELLANNKIVGPTDHELPVLAVRDEKGNLRTVIGGYACHATVLSDYFISGDWPGAGQNELERRHPNTIAMFVAGCGADQNPIPRRSIPLMNKYGREFADGVDGALKDEMHPISPSLKTAYEEIDLPFDKLPTRAELQLLTEENKPVGTWAKYMLGKWDEEGGLKSTYPYPIQVWRLGNDLNWIFLGGEVVVDYALRLKSELGTKIWVSAYSNDVMAYIPSRRVLGEGGYEGGLARYPYGLPAVWDTSVEEKVVDEVHKLVKSVK
jgi:Neutral/alkaline non-lysosomal ceramidase, N-terminal